MQNIENLTTAPRRIDEPVHGLERVRRIARRAAAMEAAGWRSIFRAIFRRPVVPPGASAHRYDAPVRTILVVFIVLSVIEVPIVDLIVHPWPWVRFPLLVLGIWGVTTMLGLLFGYLTRPHAVGPDGITVRDGGELSIHLAWDDIAAVSRRRRALPDTRGPSLTGPPDDQALNLVVEDGTDVDIELERPIMVHLPQGSATVTSVRISLDDVETFLDAVRRDIP